MAEKKYNIVYKTTNLINGKVYIGVHSTNSLNDGYIGNGVYSQASANRTGFGVPFANAVKKHGYANFKREILYEFGSAELAYWWESFLVDSEFISRDDNYNARTGGGSVGKLSAASIKRMSDALKGRKVWNSRSVVCVNTGVVYPSVRIAEHTTGTYNIVASLNGKRTTAGMLDGVRLQWKYVDPTPLMSDANRASLVRTSSGKISVNRKPIQCVTTGQVYPCAKDAELATGATNITRCARGGGHTAGKLVDGTKLVWRYL